eukprot:756767-Hanusia_phi.AAC.1
MQLVRICNATGGKAASTSYVIPSGPAAFRFGRLPTRSCSSSLEMVLFHKQSSLGREHPFIRFLKGQLCRLEKRLPPFRFHISSRPVVCDLRLATCAAPVGRLP